MEFESTASYLVSKIGVAHRNLLEKAAKRCDLHSGQIFVLMELWKNDGQRQVDLATNLGLTPPTVNKMIGGLIGSDFVTRGKYEGDARSTRIYLTRLGHDVRADFEAEWDKIEKRLLGGFTNTESLMLKDLLARLLVEIM